MAILDGRGDEPHSAVEQLATKIDQIMVSSADLAAKTAFAPISITGGVLADEAMALFAK